MHTHPTRCKMKQREARQKESKAREKSMRSAPDWNWNILVCVIRVFYTTLFPHNFGVCHFSRCAEWRQLVPCMNAVFYFLIFLQNRLPYNLALPSWFFFQVNVRQRALTNTNATTQYSINSIVNGNAYIFICIQAKRPILVAESRKCGKSSE